MKAVLISIRPKWVELIASGRKTVEIRKSRPKLETPFKCYIYCTKPMFEYEDFIALDNGRLIYGGGRVIGEFICDQIEQIGVAFRGGDGPLNARGGNNVWKDGVLEHLSCLTTDEICRYIGGIGGVGYGWHISDLKIYDTPKKLSELRSYNTLIDFEQGYPMPTHGIRRPPQSYMYVEELANV